MSCCLNSRVANVEATTMCLVLTLTVYLYTCTDLKGFRDGDIPTYTEIL